MLKHGATTFEFRASALSHLPAFIDKTRVCFDSRHPMSLDLNDLMRDWPHEPGMIKVRKILGSDGKEKIQLRIDLGLIQMETVGKAGRPGAA